jgi:hypothetical protein
MSFVRRVDIEKLGAPIVAVVFILTFLTIAFQLLRETSAPLSAAPPAAGPSYQAAVDQVPSEPAPPYQRPDDPRTNQIPASEMPRAETSPVPQPGVPQDPEDSSPSAGEQRIFKSRRALETVDPRELLRQVNMPK